MTNYELVRNKVIEAVPEILIEVDSEYPDEVSGVSYPVQIPGREIRLSDVLRAIANVPKSNKYVVDDHGVFWTLDGLSASSLSLRPFWWNLAQDDLSKQSPELLDWLIEILK